MDKQDTNSWDKEKVGKNMNVRDNVKQDMDTWDTYRQNVDGQNFKLKHVRGLEPGTDHDKWLRLQVDNLRNQPCLRLDLDVGCHWF